MYTFLKSWMFCIYAHTRNIDIHVDELSTEIVIHTYMYMNASCLFSIDYSTVLLCPISILSSSNEGDE